MGDRLDDKMFEIWARQVKIRDNWTCAICDSRGVYLEAHHKNSWDKFPEQRYLLDNGITLCRKCHQRFHEQFSYGNNTAYQYQQYEEIANLLRKFAEKELQNKNNNQTSDSREMPEEDLDIE